MKVRFQQRDADSQPRRSLPPVQSFDIAQLNNGAVRRPQSTQHISQDLRSLVLGTQLLRIRAAIRYRFERVQPGILLLLIQRVTLVRSRFSQVHFRRIQNDTVHPRGKFRPPLKLVEFQKRGKQAVLQNVLGILGIPHHPLGDSKKPGH